MILATQNLIDTIRPKHRFDTSSTQPQDHREVGPFYESKEPQST
jgi:hypothetical protein